jgi:hypothetical protein
VLAVQSAITGFHQDDEGYWVAELSCGHGVHMRDNAPWLRREWVLTAEGRQAFVGHMVNCAKCLAIRPDASDSDARKG